MIHNNSYVTILFYGVFFFFQTVYSQTIHEKLEFTPEVARNYDIGYLGSLNQQFQQTDDVLLEKELLFEMIQVADSLGNCVFFTYLYYQLSNISYGEYDMESSKKYTLNSLQYAEEYDVPYYISSAYLKLGVYEYLNEDFNEAIMYYQKGLQTDPSVELKIKFLKNITLIYLYNEYDYTIVSEYIEEGLKLYRENIDLVSEIELSWFYSYKSHISDKNSLDRFVLINKAIEIAERLDDDYVLLNHLTNKATYLHTINSKDEAIEISKRVVYLSKKNGNERETVLNYLNLADYYFQKEECQFAVKYLDSLVFYPEVFNEEVQFNYTRDKQYMLIYEQLNDYKNAFYHAQQMITFKDSIEYDIKNNIIAEAGKKFESEKKQQENKLLKKDIAIKNITLQKEATLRYFFIGFGILGILFLSLLYYRYLEKRKTNKKLLVQNKLIDSQKRNLEDTVSLTHNLNTELKRTNKTKEQFFSIIAHDLLGPFNTLLGYTTLLNKEYQEFNEQDRKKYIKIIHNAAQRNYALTVSLLHWAKLQQKRIQVDKKTWNVTTLLMKSIEIQLLEAKSKHIMVSLSLEDDVFIEADDNMMATIIRNLFNNAVKFTPKRGHISITTKIIDNTLCCIISDSGVGMSPEQLENMYNLEMIHTSQGTEGEQGNGLGLLVCKEFIEMQGGTLVIKSTLGEGTEVQLQMPLIPQNIVQLNKQKRD